MAQPIIVVPLDGSELSERAVPYAAVFARALGARVLLVTVWEGAEETLVRVLPAVAEDLFREGQAYFQKYLVGVAENYGAKDIKIDAEVLTGRAADEIVRLVEARRARMVVLASHGRSGLGRWWYGSVAADLAARAPAPTLIIGPKVLERAAKEIRHGAILVPLDGSELAESALDPARELAEKLGARVVLAQVLSWASQAFIFDVPTVTAAEIDRELTRAAEAYLARAAERLGKKLSVETKALHGMPADALLDLVAEEGIDLVVMASHGRGGVVRAALGSVADRMLQSTAPVLLVRPKARS